jgi:hypothetical protein
VSDDESAIALRKAAKMARPRVGGILAHRMDKFRALAEAELINAAKDVAMKRFAFLTDEELATSTYRGAPLTDRQKRVAREWEKSKKEAAMALHSSDNMVVNALRAQQAQPGISINVERAVIRVPDTKPDDAEDPIYIDVEATLGDR